MSVLLFRPRLIPTLASVCALALFVNLGLWQAGKGERLLALREQMSQRGNLDPLPMTARLVDSQDVHDVPMRVRGEFEPEQQFFVDNRQENGVAGLHVVTPLHIAGGQTRVLVNRGWVAWPRGRSALPVVSTPAGTIELQGLASVPSQKAFWLMPDRSEAWPQLWPRLDLQRFTAQAKYPVQPVALLQTSDAGGEGLMRHWPLPEDRVAKHQSYSWQWFGMALALLIFYGVSSLKRVERS